MAGLPFVLAGACAEGRTLFLFGPPSRPPTPPGRGAAARLRRGGLLGSSAVGVDLALSRAVRVSGDVCVLLIWGPLRVLWPLELFGVEGIVVVYGRAARPGWCCSLCGRGGLGFRYIYTHISSVWWEEGDVGRCRVVSNRGEGAPTGLSALQRAGAAWASPLFPEEARWLLPSRLLGSRELWQSPSGFDFPNLKAVCAGETERFRQPPPLTSLSSGL